MGLKQTKNRLTPKTKKRLEQEGFSLEIKELNLEDERDKKALKYGRVRR